MDVLKDVEKVTINTKILTVKDVKNTVPNVKIRLIVTSVSSQDTYMLTIVLELVQKVSYQRMVIVSKNQIQYSNFMEESSKMLTETLSSELYSGPFMITTSVML
jgi:hypothetical protein